MSFAERLLRRRQGLDAINGINGGSLQDQLDRDPYDNPDALLSQSPDRMSGVPSTQAQPQTQPPIQPNVAQPQVSPFQSRLASGRARVADPTEFDAQHLRELEGQKDPRWEKILNAAAAGVTSAAQGGAPIKPIPTRRERDIQTVEGRLGRDAALDKNKIAIAQGQMVPFILPDGTTTMVPAKSTGALASRQQGQQANLSIRRQQLEAHKGRWDQMASHEAAQDAQRVYNSGQADDNDDLKAEVVRRMGLPIGSKLPNHDKGQVQVDGQGNFTLINPKTAEAKPITQQTEPTQPLTANPADVTRPRTATAPVQSFKVTQEAAKDERSRLGRAAAMDRALVMARATSARMGDPSEYENLATQADKDASDAEVQAKEVGPRHAAPYLSEAGRAKARATQLRELANKAKGGQSLGTTPQSQSTAQPQGRVSRQNFRRQNPSFKNKSDVEVDAAITGAGHIPY